MTPITSNMGRASGRGPSLGMYRSDGDLIFILIDIIYYILSLSSLFKVKVKKMYSSSSSVYWHSNLVDAVFLVSISASNITVPPRALSWNASDWDPFEKYFDGKYLCAVLTSTVKKGPTFASPTEGTDANQLSSTTWRPVPCHVSVSRNVQAVVANLKGFLSLSFTNFALCSDALSSLISTCKMIRDRAHAQHFPSISATPLGLRSSLVTCGIPSTVLRYGYKL